MEPLTLKTAASTPASSPGLFSPMNASHASLAQRQQPPSLSDGTPQNSPYLHPLQMHKVRETHKAEVDKDFITGRKLINQYEIIDEIGRGVHGKVKLARSLETGDYVAIKIIQRFSKKRRLGRVTVSPEDKTKREIAILKKIRHPNVVGLLEVIDDPEFKKIYMVLEHVELGEIVWRKKGLPQICQFERRRLEREQRGEVDTGEDEKYYKILERRRQRKQTQRAKLTSLQTQQGNAEHWSLEHGDDDSYYEEAPLSRQVTSNSERNIFGSYKASMMHSNPASRNHSRATSRAPSRTSSRAHTPLPEYDIGALDSDNEDDEPLQPHSTHGSASALDGTYYGSYPDEPPYRGRTPSTTDSIISHMSSVEDYQHDIFEEDFSYVPCFTIDQARSAFRDTVLGLEYLHYEGIVHRDIKPANLLWTKDHRVKISDFGVSYFGRPIRPGETEENISEADATDFDDDLELAKTVGTPAFFAPELCYTDENEVQPKVTEQIDIWSLGVTLYCLIYARLPFLADDEFQLFKCIAKNDVYIPRKRLKAIAPSDKRMGGPSVGPYREEAELSYEEIDTDLHDLLKRMLIKNPLERIKLREVKRHPWVLAGIDNILGWIDDTDPSRKAAGRRIQVDRTELDHAVVPITFLERARSALKKTIGNTVQKVIGATRSERSEGSRRRAVSSATSSGTDNIHTPITPLMRASRRASLRGDESYFASVNESHEHREPTEHPLAQSLTASPDLSLDGEDPFSLDFYSVGATPKPHGSGISNDEARPKHPDRTVSSAASITTVVDRGHGHSRSIAHTPTSPFLEEGPTTPGPFTDHHGNVFGGHGLWRGREYLSETEETTLRAKSAERGVFTSENKHVGASVAMDKTPALGHFEHSTPLQHPKPLRSAEVSPTSDRPLPSPLFFQPYMVNQHQMLQSSSTPNVPQSVYAASNLDERPATANRTPEGKTPAPRVFSSTPESFARAKQEQQRKRKLEDEERKLEAELKEWSKSQIIPPTEPTPCPESPDDQIFRQKQEEARLSRPQSHCSTAPQDDPSRAQSSSSEVPHESPRAQSSSSVNSSYLTSQMTSPSDLISPTSSSNLGSQEKFFTSVPSLPALVSSGSSVAADPEDDFLQHPGVVPPQAVLSDSGTPETITPPLSKEPSHDEAAPTATIAIDADDDGYHADGDTMTLDDDDSSDSDEGLTMMRKKPVAKVAMARRGTNASAGSTDTAKKVVMDN